MMVAFQKWAARGLPVVAMLAVIGTAAAAPLRMPQDQAAQIDDLVIKAIDTNGPGCVVGVLKGGDVSYARARGLASVELGVPLTASTVMDIGSISKQFTGMIVLLLAQEKAISLDDDVRKYLPELPNYGTTVTLRHLLHQTSGVRDYASLFYLAGVADETPTTQADALALVVRQKRLNFPAGSEALYSNSNYLLLTAVIERVTGRSLDDLYKERIFGPLKMTDTSFREGPEPIVARRAASYSANAAHQYGAWSANGHLRGSGGINSTLADLARWLANFEHPIVGDNALIRDMLASTTLPDKRLVPYGAGVVVDTYRGLRRITHNGGSAGFRATLTLYPDLQTGIAVLCNTSLAAPHRMSERIADIILADRVARLAAEQTEAVDRFEGVYYAPRRDEYRMLRVVDGKLRLIGAPGDDGRVLTSLGQGRFRPQDLGPEILIGQTGETTTLTIQDALNAPIEYRRIQGLDLWKPADLKRYAGVFVGEEIDATWTIEAVEDGLQLKRRSNNGLLTASSLRSSVLTPVVPNVFISNDGIVVRFREGVANGGFSASAARLVGLSFRRSANAK